MGSNPHTNYGIQNKISSMNIDANIKEKSKSKVFSALVA
jgi:hypothetical protein